MVVAVFPPHYLPGAKLSGGNEDNGDLLQKVPCTHCYTQCPPNPAAGHHWPTPPLETPRHSWASLGQCLMGHCSFLLVLVHTRFVWTLWASLVGMGFDSKCKFSPPSVLQGLLLCPCWHCWACEYLLIAHVSSSRQLWPSMVSSLTIQGNVSLQNGSKSFPQDFLERPSINSCTIGLSGLEENTKIITEHSFKNCCLTCILDGSEDDVA